MSEIISSFGYVISAFKLITKPGIRAYIIIPLLINTTLFTGVIVYGAHMLGGFIDWISAQWSWAEWLQWLLWPLFVVIALTIVFFCFSILANLISAPFNGYLARAVENYLTGNVTADDDFKIGNIPAEFFTAIRDESRKFVYFTIRALPLLILFIIPLVQAAAPFIWFLFGSWIMALEYLDYPMGNQGTLFPEIRKQVAKKRGTCIGFGMGVMILTMMPVLNFIAMPVAVIGATKLWLEKFNGQQ